MTARSFEILLVDDRPLVRLLLLEMLDDAGLQAAEAASMEEALELVRSATEKGSSAVWPAVLVTATRPGGLNGRTLAVEVAQRRPGAQVPGVVHIGQYPPVPASGSLGVGERFLREPFGLPVLTQAVHELLGRPVPRWVLGRFQAVQH